MEKNKLVIMDGRELMVSLIKPCSWHSAPGSPMHWTRKVDLVPFSNLF